MVILYYLKLSTQNGCSLYVGGILVPFPWLAASEATEAAAIQSLQNLQLGAILL